LPNPFSDFLSLEFNVIAPSNISISIYDLMGQQIKSVINNQSFDEGKFRQEIDMSLLPVGHYVFQININGELQYLQGIKVN